jgi:hypothetical protein
VNLYIDRQITAAETAELEAEIQSNPRRRAIYRQYCKMHRATTLVYESFRASAPEQQTAAGAGTIAHFEKSRRTGGSPWKYYAGGLAAAACLAIVFVQLNSTQAPEASLAASAPVLPATKVAVVPRVPAPPATPVAEPKAGLVSLRNNVGPEADYQAALTALRLRTEEPRAFANGPVQPSRTPSLFDDGVFDPQQVLPANTQRVFRSKQAPEQQQAEFTAFQFQR